MYRSQPGLGTHLFGFAVGFFFGCCGVVWAMLLGRDYLPSVVAGVVAQMFFGSFVGLIEASTQGRVGTVRFGDPSLGEGLAWEPMAIFAIATVWVVAAIAGGVYLLRSGRDDDDDPPPGSDSQTYVTYTR